MLGIVQMQGCKNIFLKISAYKHKTKQIAIIKLCLILKPVQGKFQKTLIILVGNNASFANELEIDDISKSLFL